MTDQKEERTAEAVVSFQNRIVGEGVKPASWFFANPDNFRDHPADQQAAVDGLLQEIGWVQKCIVNVRKGEQWGADLRNKPVLLDGHLRVVLAKKQGAQTPVPFVKVDLSPSEEALMLAALDESTMLAEVNKTRLQNVFEAIETKNADLIAFLDEVAQRRKLELHIDQKEETDFADFKVETVLDLVDFQLGDYKAKVSAAVYKAFVLLVEGMRKGDEAPLLDDVLKGLLNVRTEAD